MSTHRLAVRVYYEDTDFSGVVYHASYLRFFERGRTEFLRDLGIAQADLFTAGEAFAFAVTQMTIDFRRAARMDDLLTVETGCVELGRASLTMRQRIMRDSVVLTEASVRIAALAGGRPVRLPADLRASLAPLAEDVKTTLTPTDDVSDRSD